MIALESVTELWRTVLLAHTERVCLTVMILHRAPSVSLTRGPEILAISREAGLDPRVLEAGAGQTGGPPPGVRGQLHDDEVLASALPVTFTIPIVI